MTFLYKTSALLTLSFIILSHFSLSAQSLEKQVDNLIKQEFSNSNQPGAVFMVAHKGKPIYIKAFGKANLELDVNLNPQSVFQLGSITKQFTAVALLMLEQQKKLTVNDPITKYIPDFPAGDNITIHHLLTHTSGIRDFTKMKALGSISQKEMTPRMMVDFFKNEPVDFLPGDRFEYNNSGYVILGYIIEQVSGQSYQNFIDQNIFKRLQMDNSYYASDKLLIANRAYGYQQKEKSIVNKSKISFSIPFSSGSLMSNAADMLKWQNALNQNLLIDTTETNKAFQTYKLNNGSQFSYGYGWHIREMNGIPIREHGGSIFGFKSMGVYIPTQDIYVLGLSNCDFHSPTSLTEDIAALCSKLLK